VFIGNGLRSIERGTFSGCSSLTNIIIPNSVTSIGAGAFADCTSLTSIIIPNSVTSIGTGAFADCTSLRSVNIPDSITLIESETFRGCSSLANIVIPNSIDSMGDNAFGDCSSLTSVTIPDSVTIIGYKSFGGCSSLTNVTIPDSVISIGDDAFRDCTNLINIIIPDSISSFGNYVFRGCSNLTSVTFMNGIISIGGGMFFECGSLTSVTIPDSVTSIGAKAFRDCSSLVNIYFGGTMRQWEAISKGYNWDDGIGNYTVYCIDTPKTENLLANPSFEEQSLDSWILTEMGSADELQVENRPEDALKGNCCLHFYGSKADSVCFFVEQEVGISESGNYQFSISIMGGRGGKYEIYAYVKINGEILKTDDLSLAEYGNWDTAEISNIACEEGDVLTVGIYVKCQGEGEGAWGSIDDALLYKEN